MVPVAEGVVNPAEADAPDATNDELGEATDGLGEATWRASRAWSAWAATKMGTTARTAEQENFMEDGNKEELWEAIQRSSLLYFTKTKNRNT